MHLSAGTKIFWCLLLSFFISNIPYVGTAAFAGEMISTSVVVDELTRQQAENKVRDVLSQTDIRSELVKRGVSPDEVSNRLASLSDRELKDLSQQIEQARAGGDGVVSVLLIVVLVLLVIFLAKRI